jgi:hypothetical protein
MKIGLPSQLSHQKFRIFLSNTDLLNKSGNGINGKQYPRQVSGERNKTYK